MKTSKLFLLLVMVTLIILSAACSNSTGSTGTEPAATTKDNLQSSLANQNSLIKAQPMPTDIEFSIDRYNLIRRAYWIGGEKEKSAQVPCPIKLPIGYVSYFTESGSVIETHEVAGNITSLTSLLSPISGNYVSDGLLQSSYQADINGCYGTARSGIFFFTPEGEYMEYNGTYSFTSTPPA